MVDVAPHAGAWIETYCYNVWLFASWSRLTQARGLKLVLISLPLPCCLSRLTQARGLKRKFPEYHGEVGRESRLTQARGLKQQYQPSADLNQDVAPHAGAWIETTVSAAPMLPAMPVAPHAGAWIETCQGMPMLCALEVAPHAGAWIETR